MFNSKKVIANSAVAREYQKYLLKKEDKDQVIGVSTQPFDAVFYQVYENKDYDLFYRYKMLSQQQNPYEESLPDYFFSYDNFGALLKLSKEIKEYDIELNKLEPRNKKDYFIIEAVQRINIEIKNINNSSLSYIEEGLGHSQQSYLKRNAISKIELEANEGPKKVKIFKTKNPLHSYMHVLENLDCKEHKILILSPNKAKDLALVKKSCDNLGIPYISNTSNLNISKKVFCDLLDFYIVLLSEDDEATTRKLVSLLKSKTLEIPNSNLVIDYMELYDLKYSDLFELNKHPMKKEGCKNKNILDSLKTLVENLQDIFSCEDPQNVVINIYNKTKEKDNIGSKPIKKILQNVIGLIDETNLEYLLDSVNAINTYHFESPYFDFASYQDAPFFPNERTIIMGLNSFSYPNVNSQKGLIDESFLELLSIHGYPDQETRIKNELINKERIFKSSSSELHIYTHELDFEGKPVQMIDIKDFFDEKTVINKITVPFIIQESKDDGLAFEENLTWFFEKKPLRLSPSKIAGYLSNPKEYLEEKLFGIKDDIDTTLPLLLGSLNHNVLELYHPKKATENIQFDRSQYNEMMNKFMEKVDIPYNPFNEYIFDLNYEYISAFLKFSHENLGEKYHIINRELHVEHNLLMPDQNRVVICGYIDRVDESDDGQISIIDYKTSSHKSLKLNKIVTDQEYKYLQLVSYMYLYEKKYGKLPEMAYLFQMTPIVNEEKNRKIRQTKTKVNNANVNLRKKDQQLTFKNINRKETDNNISYNFLEYYEAIVEKIYELLSRGITDKYFVKNEIEKINDAFIQE